MKERFLLLSLSVLVLTFAVGYGAYAQGLESIDIGDAADNPGSTEIAGGMYTISGSGSDIWESADGFRFAYTKLSGNFEAVAHQISTVLPVEWAKHGIHARQSVDPGAVNAQAIVTGGGASGCQITWRQVDSGASSEFMDSAPGPWKDIECWLKLTREGDEFHGYISEDGEEWQDLNFTTVEMSDPILVGLAVCGNGNVATAVYDEFIITQNGRQLFPYVAVEQEGKLSVMWGKVKSK